MPVDQTTPASTNPFAYNAVIDRAKSVADVAVAARADPALMNALLAAAGQLLTGNGKALLQSKSFWSAILTPVASFLVTHYALGLDDQTVLEVTSGLSAAMAILMRCLTKTPITGVVAAAPVALGRPGVPLS